MKRQKTGGRKKGTLNKRTNQKFKALAKQGITAMEFFLGMMRDEEASIEDRKWAAAHVALYTLPKLQAVELTGEVHGDISHSHSGRFEVVSIEDATERVAEIRTRLGRAGVLFKSN